MIADLWSEDNSLTVLRVLTARNFREQVNDSKLNQWGGFFPIIISITNSFVKIERNLLAPCQVFVLHSNRRALSHYCQLRCHMRPIQSILPIANR
jgi:hypothetical protein